MAIAKNTSEFYKNYKQIGNQSEYNAYAHIINRIPYDLHPQNNFHVVRELNEL